MIRHLASSSLAFLLLFAVPACGGGGSGDPDGGHGGNDAGPGDLGTDAGDSSPPQPGNAGDITTSNPTSSSVDLTWTAGTDSTTPQADLEYRVYYSLASNLDTVADVLANGTPANEWTANLDTLTVSPLSLATIYFFNVLVRDEAGNLAVYEPATDETLAGAWQDATALETYTGGSVYYSTLSASPTGDVAAFWDQQPTWDLHVAVRREGDSGFSAPLPWAPSTMYTDRLTYDFDGRLFGTSLRVGDTTDDLLFASASHGEETTFEPVVEGVATGAVRWNRSCVSSADDVLVVWIEETAADVFAVRARVRTGTTWGTTLLVSSADDLDLFGLEVVCRPNGDHVVLFGEDAGSSNVLQSRIFDASAGTFMASVPLGTFSYQYDVLGALASDGRVAVAWSEYDDGDALTYFRARTLTGDTWSSTETLTDSEAAALDNFQLAAVAADFVVTWTSGGVLTTSRLAAGESLWSEPGTIVGVSSYEFCLSGNAEGFAVLSWVSGADVEAKRLTPSSATWSDAFPVFDGSTQIGSGSLSCVVDARGRSTVVYTVWDPDGMQFSAFERTHR